MAVYTEFQAELLEGIVGVSYIGKPQNNTIMYMTKKIENRILGLSAVKNCLVFLENNIIIPQNIVDSHIFLFCKDPAGSYTEIVRKLQKKIDQNLREKKYTFTNEGYFIGENVTIGDNTIIEPNVFIDHDVIIGNDGLIKAGARIRYGTMIGDKCSIGENTVIGEPGFNSARLANGEFVIMPALGKTIIGNNVYIGANTSVSKGSADNTVIEDNVKIDSNVRIGHDVLLHEDCEVRGAACIAGYAEIGRNTEIGAGANIKNRIIIGNNCFIGMGCYLNRNLKSNSTVTGNPAITLENFGKKKMLEAEIKSFLRNNRGKQEDKGGI